MRFSRSRSAVPIALAVFLCGVGGWLERSFVRSALGFPTYDELRRRLVWRAAVPVAAIRSANVLVLLVTGQSNAGNYGDAFPAPNRPSICELFGPRLVEARNPFLGSDGAGSAPWIAAGNRLIDRHFCDAVVFALAVQGGTAIGEWLPGKPMHEMLFRRLAELRRAGLSPGGVLWQQGESDARYSPRESKLRYGQILRGLIASMRERGVGAPVLVAIATRTSSNPPDPIVRQQQFSVINPALAIFPGPDTDTLGPEYRRDGTHFNAMGESRLAELWYEALAAVPLTSRRPSRS